jgi:glutamine---fructose-6-phosphate transaminase (isomerizing)
MKIRRCKICILPENYTGLTISSDGVCNFCKEKNEHHYLGKDKLSERINNILLQNPERKYDCVVGFSGGRDSTFLLWYIVKELHLKPLAVFIDSGLIPEQTIQNINKTIQLLNVDLKIIKHDFLKKYFKFHFQTWLKRPKPETLITFCVGCRLGVNNFVDDEAIKQSIPIVFGGGSPFEGKQYKSKLIKLNPNHKSNISFILGYLKQAALNPQLILNPLSFWAQIKEYYTIIFLQKRKLNKHGIERIALYHTYIKWEEKVIEKTLKDELNWERYPGLRTSYRGDCEIGIIRQFMYWKLLGYNDKDDHLSCLIRDQQITRDDAMDRLNNEHYVPVEILERICKDAGIEYSDIEKITKKYKTEHIE